MPLLVNAFTPHSRGQHELIESTTNDAVLAGRRWGKTAAGSMRVMKGVLTDPGVYWWVGLSWQSASMTEAWRYLQRWHAMLYEAKGLDPAKYKSLLHKQLFFPRGGEVSLRTAENPASLAGAGVKGAILDEFTLMREKVWTEYVRGTLVDHNGWVMMIGVPKGQNWGARIWRNAATRRGWRQWRFTTFDNFMLPPESLEELREEARYTPHLIYQQEYMAQIMSGLGTVFTRVTECTGAPWEEAARPGGAYIFGLDWGKKNDFTVITVLDITRNAVVHIDRFNQIDYPTQLSRVRALNERFHPSRIIAETNAMGEPLCDQLTRDGLPIQKFVTTHESKRNMIESLAVAFEQDQIRIPAYEPLMDELAAFEGKAGELGRMKYSAPEGFHDDTVISLAIAWTQCGGDIGI